MAQNKSGPRESSIRISGRTVKVIGLGGIGAAVAQAMVQFLCSRKTRNALWLIDGDAYEERNRDRVLFQSYENKTVAKARELTLASAGGVVILPVPKYVTPRNARRLIDDGDIVFLCVDNHATRNTVSRRCRGLDEIVLISGGNDGIEDGQEGTYGNVQVYIREARCDVTNPLTRFHPEIARPRDKRPDELGCATLSRSAPQLLFTNLTVASAMLGTFYAWLSGKLAYEEVYLDVALGRMTPVQRALPRRASAGTGSEQLWTKQVK